MLMLFAMHLWGKRGEKNKMSSQFSRDLEQTFQDTKKIREETARLLGSGDELAFKEIHGSNFEKLKEKIKTGKI